MERGWELPCTTRGGRILSGMGDGFLWLGVWEAPAPDHLWRRKMEQTTPAWPFLLFFFCFVLRSGVQRAAQVKHSRAKDLHSPSLLPSAGSHSTSTPRRA